MTTATKNPYAKTCAKPYKENAYCAFVRQQRIERKQAKAASL